jgi:hypothetical protein
LLFRWSGVIVSILGSKYNRSWVWAQARSKQRLILVFAASCWNKSLGRCVIPLGHIILNLNKPIFALTSNYSMLSQEAANTNISLCLDLAWAQTHDLLYLEPFFPLMDWDNGFNLYFVEFPLSVMVFELQGVAFVNPLFRSVITFQRRLADMTSYWIIFFYINAQFQNSGSKINNCLFFANYWCYT